MKIPGDVVDEQRGCHTFIVCFSDGFEGFLAGLCDDAYRVPYLNFDVLLIDHYHFGSELNADGDVVLRSKPFVCELEEDA